MAGEDVTFCTYTGCKRVDCEWHPHRIRQDRPHSFADLQGDPRYCPRAAVSNVGWPHNAKAKRRTEETAG